MKALNKSHKADSSNGASDLLISQTLQNFPLKFSFHSNNWRTPTFPSSLKMIGAEFSKRLNWLWDLLWIGCVWTEMAQEGLLGGKLALAQIVPLRKDFLFSLPIPISFPP